MSVEEDLMLCRKYMALVDGAAARDIAFNLSLTALKNLRRSRKCFYTGKPFTEKDGLSIDRVDNSKGYEDGNVVACLTSLNTKKGNLSVEEILALAKGIKKKIKEL